MSADDPTTNMAKNTTKRVRVNFTETQLCTMETVFKQSQYPDVTVLEILSDRLDLRLEKICTWFQNRRSKFRRESKKGHIDWMRKQLYLSHDATSATRKESVLSPVIQSTRPECGQEKQRPTVNIHHLPEFSKSLIPLSMPQEPTNLGCNVPSSSSDYLNICNNNNMSRPPSCYFNYQQYLNDSRCPVGPSASSSTSTSWSCTTPSMSTPQNYLTPQRMPRSTCADNNLTDITNYPYHTTNLQMLPGYASPTDTTTAINNNENLTVSPPAMLSNRHNTFNNCHFHGPVSF